MTVPERDEWPGNGYQRVTIRVRERHDDRWAQRTTADSVSEECPVALVYNGIAHAVMMATPTDLEDFALGFSLSERIVTVPGQLFDTEVVDRGEQGIELQMHIHGACANALNLTQRNLIGPTGCGLCGKASHGHYQGRKPSRPPSPASTSTNACNR